MEQKVLNEQQMREYIENEVRAALIAEGIDETLEEGPWLEKIMGLLGGSAGKGVIGQYIKEHMNPADLINLAIGVFGVAPIVRWLCGVLGINIDGPLAKLLVTGLSALGTVKVGDMIQNTKASNGLGGNTSVTGGGNPAGAAVVGGSR